MEYTIYYAIGKHFHSGRLHSPEEDYLESPLTITDLRTTHQNVGTILADDLDTAYFLLQGTNMTDEEYDRFRGVDVNHPDFQNGDVLADIQSNHFERINEGWLLLR